MVTAKKTPVRKTSPAGGKTGGAVSAPSAAKRAKPRPVAVPQVVAGKKTTAAPAAGEQTPARKKVRLAKAFERPLDKKIKAAKSKLVRDRFTFSEEEHNRLVNMKKQLAAQGCEVKKSQLVRAGLQLLSALDEKALKTLIGKFPPLG